MHKFLAFFIVIFFSGKVFGQLSAQFSADRLSGCAPIRVQFTDASTGGPTEWSWDLGNGTLSPLQNPSTTYFSPGTYTITLTVKKAGQTDAIVKTNYITVYPNPTVRFSGTPTSGCLPMDVHFRDSSLAGLGTITNWNWDFGDGFLGSGQNPSHVYRSQGKFQVTLTVTNSSGCTTSDSKSNYITAFDSIKANFGITAPPTCKVPATFSFTDSSLGSNIISYTWDFGDGATSTQQSPSHTYTTAGGYDITLRIRNTNGCEDVLIKRGLVNAGNFNANFTSNANACIGQPLAFFNTSTPISLLDSVRWDFGNGQTSKVFSPLNTYFAMGSYQVKLVSKFGACADSTVKTITVIPKPKASFTAAPTGTCKPPLTVNFTNTTVGGTVVRWDFSNGDTSTQENPSVVFKGVGRFDVRLIVRNASGCFDTLTQKALVKIQQPVIDEIEGLPFIGCFPWTNNFGLKVTSGDPVVSYQWDFGDGTTSTLANPQHTYVDTGKYFVKAIIVTSQGCTDTLIKTVHGGAKPKANFEGAPRLVCPSDPVNFKDLSTGMPDYWFWEFGDGGVSNEQNPEYKYTDTGWMHVTLTTYSNGCADTIDFDKYLYVNPPIARFSDSFVCGNQFVHYFNESSIGALYWKWYIDDKDSIEARNITRTFLDTGVHKIRLWVTDSICVNESIQNIFILDEEAAFVTSDTGNCTSTTVTFRAQGPKTHPYNILKYSWLFGDNTAQVSTTGPVVNHVYNKRGVYNVRLIITDLNNCRDTVIIPINVRLYGPKANFGPVYTAICAGNAAVFTDSTVTDISNPIKSWKWNFGDGSTATFLNPPFSHIYSTPGFYDVSLRVTDSLGCTDSINRKIAVGVYKPKANFVSPDTIVCINAPVKLTNTSTGSVLKANWSFGNGLTSTTFNPQTKYGAAGQYDVKLVISDSINCKDSITRIKYITVGDAVAKFSLSDSFTTCPPLIVSFTNKSTNNAVNYWSFGNGNSSFFNSPSHTYTTPGTFQVKLLVTGNGGCKDSTIKTIAIQGPSGKFSYAPLTGCPPLKVFFTSNAINTRVITWDFSDGESTVTVDSLTTHIYDLPGTFVPKAIFSDTIGCKLPIQGPDTIRVVGAKAFIKSLKKFNYCDSTTISFTDSTVATDVVVSYLWDFGDGTTSTSRNPSHYYAKPGKYRVIFEVRTLRGCISRDTLPENIIVAPTPIISSGPNTPVCVPSSVKFTGNWLNSDTSVLTYNWSFGNGASSQLLSPAPVLYDKPGNYLVRLLAFNRYGCGDTADINLVVNDTPRVRISQAPYLCKNKSTTLTATGATQYQWNPTSSLSCLNCAAPVAKPPFTEMFRVVGTDANGCKSSNTMEVKVKQPAFLSVGPGDTLCVGESFKLFASGTERYLWKPATGLSSATIPNPVATPVTTTRYMVVGYDSMNCFFDTGYVSMVVYPIPKFNIIDDKITAATGSIINLKTTNSADITHWHWTPPIGLSCTICPEPEMTVSKSITYTARVSNDGGCTAQDVVSVVPICSGENVFIPNTFSPNADGHNDLFYPRSRGIATIRSMRIFNRWGELLYEVKDFMPNDPGKGWDGTYRGAKLTPDVYVYMVEVLCDNSVIINMKGNVTLLK